MSNHPAITTSKKRLVNRINYAWVILIVVYFSSIAAPLNQFKVPPIMPFVIEAFELNLGNAGFFMSIFAITGVILALPAGFILQKLGLKTTGLIALGCLVIGSVMGAFAGSASIMLTSRVIEGVGMGFMTVLAPTAIAVWFPPEKRGLPMGIWASWVPVGTLIMLLIAPSVAQTTGWQMVWWIGAAFSLIMFVLYALFVHSPTRMRIQTAGNQGISQPSENKNLWKALGNRDIWLMGVLFACFTFNGLGWSTFYPTFLASERGFSLTNASLIYSISTVMSIFSCLIAGSISDRIGSRRLVFTLPAIPLAFLPPLMYQATGIWIPILLVCYGLLICAIPTAVFSAVPEVMDKPHLAGLGLAVITLGQNMGFVFGPAFFGMIASRFSWTIASLSLIPVMLLAFLVGWRVNVR